MSILNKDKKRKEYDLIRKRPRKKGKERERKKNIGRQIK